MNKVLLTTSFAILLAAGSAHAFKPAECSKKINQLNRMQPSAEKAELAREILAKCPQYFPARMAAVQEAANWVEPQGMGGGQVPQDQAPQDDQVPQDQAPQDDQVPQDQAPQDDQAPQVDLVCPDFTQPGMGAVFNQAIDIAQGINPGPLRIQQHDYTVVRAGIYNQQDNTFAAAGTTRVSDRFRVLNSNVDQQTGQCFVSSKFGRFGLGGTLAIVLKPVQQ